MSKIVWGADPEFGSAYEEEGIQYILPPVVLREDYAAPFEIGENESHPIFKRYEGGFIHEDGAAFEMSVAPRSDWKDLWDNINSNKEDFGKAVLSQYPGVCLPQLFSIPAMHYQVDKWINRGIEFQLATLFGCDPDKDYFNLRARAKVIDAKLHPWRYLGGHIHVSGLPEIADNPLPALASMIYTAGLASTAYTDVPKIEKKRIFLYGRPGKFRIQKYKNGEIGIEYRTPSTRWTANKDLAEKIFSWAETGMLYLFQGKLLEKIESKIREDAIKAITTVNQVLARELLSYIASQI